MLCNKPRNMNYQLLGRTPKGMIGSVQRDDPVQLKRVLDEKKTMLGLDDLAKALHLSCDLGHSECVSVLLSHGTLPDVHASGGYTPVIIASRQGHHEVVKMLVKAGCNVNKQTSRVRATALHSAAAKGHLKVTKLLINAGSDIEARTARRQTPLMLAARSDYPDVVDLLVANGCDVNAKDSANATALHLAAEEGSVDSVKVLLAAGADHQAKTRKGDSPTLNAARRGFPETLRVLLGCGDIDLKQVCQELSLMHWAAFGGSASCVLQLLERGVDPNQQTVRGYCGYDLIVASGVTPLMLAAKYGHYEALQALVHSGSLVDVCDGEAMTALLYATRGDHGRCIEVLACAGADLSGAVRLGDGSDIHGMSPLIVAAERASLRVLVTLIRLNADVNQKGFGRLDQSGNKTAFEAAFQLEHHTVCAILLRAGAKALNFMYSRTLSPGDLDLLRMAQNALSLKGLCRLTICKHAPISAIKTLPLPPLLRDFCHFEDLNELVENNTCNMSDEEEDNY